MPRMFQVVRCYQCQTYQVKQQTKASKWSCKICGEKQSLVKVFFEGTAADCRINTQTLNSCRAQTSEQQAFQKLQKITTKTNTLPRDTATKQSSKEGSISKWDQLSPERSHDHDHQRFSERITPELDETVKLTGAGQKRKGLPITDTDNKKTATCETVAPKGVITQKPTNSIWSQFE